MSKYARTRPVELTPAPTVSLTFSAPAVTPQVADILTGNAGAGFSRDVKSELFLLAATNMVGEQTFYESAGKRDERFVKLIHEAIATDPAWVAALIPYVRGTLNLRTAAIVMAAEYARSYSVRSADRPLVIHTPHPAVSKVVDSAMLRADEPAEMLAYWMQTYGAPIATDAPKVKGRAPRVRALLPMGLKRGLAKAVTRLYDERAALKWDSDKASVRMGDVIELVHPEPKAPWQSALFRYLIDDRHNRTNPGIRVPEAAIQPSLADLGLRTISARDRMNAVPVESRRLLLAAGMAEALTAVDATWEWLAGWLQGPMDALAWQAIVPRMGYMALLRNLRNLDDAKVDEATVALVQKRLSDPEEVAKSRQLPIRFYSAYDAVKTGRWSEALRRALDLTLLNTPALTGRTLVMVDISSSMGDVLSHKTTRTRWEVAALFGGAIAARAESARLLAFHTTETPIIVRPGMSPLYVIDAIRPLPRGGTATWDVAHRAFARERFDRVVIVTDEQADPWSPGYTMGYENQSTIRPDLAIPPDVPVYTVNVAGYRAGHSPSASVPNRYTFGGLSDAVFTGIAAIELGRSTGWNVSAWNASAAG